MIYVTKDTFVWLDVTKQLTKSPRAWVESEIYAVHDDDSESLLESIEEVIEAINLGLRLCVEGGYLPSKYTPQEKTKPCRAVRYTVRHVFFTLFYYIPKKPYKK